MNTTLRQLAAIYALCALCACGGSKDTTDTANPVTAPTDTTSTSKPGSISIGAAQYSVAQSAGSVKISVSRTGGATGAVSVSLATTNGSATAGVDYTGSMSTMNWTDGDATAKSFNVPISNAQPFSGTKTFNVTMSSPTGGATMGATTSVVVTITGSGVSTSPPPPTTTPPTTTPPTTPPTTTPPATTPPPASAGSVSFSSSNFTVTQNLGSLTISVVRLQGSSGAVSVAYATANGSAIAGTDYTSKSGTLSWADGDAAAKSFSIAILNNAALTTARTLTITLSGASGGVTLVSPTSASVSISKPVSSQGAMGEAAAARLLQQGTFGTTLSSLKTASAQSYDQWFADQAALPVTLEEPKVTTNWRVPVWWYNAVNGQDQLRLRMAFALSEIFVVSETHPDLSTKPQALSHYYDLLAKGALGNFRDLLDNVSHSPVMGHYLSFFKNEKPDSVTGVHADENYAREVMQLFTIGLWKLNMDGSLQRDGSGKPISTYGQADVTNLARVFTGWGSKPLTSNVDFGWTYDSDLLNPMVCYANHHDANAKTIIGGVGVVAGGTCESEMKVALDTLFNHPNVAPFISQQLIQRLVTSNPSPAYVNRVASVFANNGKGVRGDLLAVVKAILTDAEAVNASTAPGAGKLREPVLRLTGLWRAFAAATVSGNIVDQTAGNATGDFAQQSLLAPTVFNFFRPDYQRAGPLTTAGLVAPEFQITNVNTAVMISNDLQYAAYKFVDSTGKAQVGIDAVGGQNAPSGQEMVLKTAEWEQYAGDTATLLNKLDVVFMAGQMPSGMRTLLTTYINSVPASTPAYRVIEAASLIVNSPQYAVQR